MLVVSTQKIYAIQSASFPEVELINSVDVVHMAGVFAFFQLEHFTVTRI